MDVVLVYKWSRDPDEIFVYDDGHYKLRRDRLTASSDDVAAIANARRLAEATGGKVIGATIGSGDVSWAMARGAETAVSIEGLMPEKDDAQTAASLVQAILAADVYDFVVMGESRDAALVAPIVAAMLGLPLITGVQDFQLDPDNADSILAHRRVGKTIFTLRIAPPALINVAAIEQEREIPTMKQMLAAKKAPVTKLEAQASAPCKVTERALRRPPLHPAKVFDGPIPEAVDSLVAALRADEAL